MTTCQTCPFWCPDDDNPEVGDCRIRAPRHETVEGGDSRVFPATTAEDWCGEHPLRIVLNTGSEL